MIISDWGYNCPGGMVPILGNFLHNLRLCVTIIVSLSFQLVKYGNL